MKKLFEQSFTKFRLEQKMLLCCIFFGVLKFVDM